MQLKCVLGLILATPVAMHAQATPAPAPENELSVNVGIAQVDGTGVHTAPIASIELARAFGRPWIVFQLGASILRVKENYAGSATTDLIPEAQFQFQRPSGIIRPYVGVGVGVLVVSNEDASGIARMLSAGVGVRADVSSRYGVRAEVRARGVGSGFGGSITEGTIGLSRRF